jgi:hypothetical protein
MTLDSGSLGRRQVGRQSPNLENSYVTKGYEAGPAWPERSVAQKKSELGDLTLQEI